jgi:predicted metal-dependent HD superfamily phosphohydrolase
LEAFAAVRHLARQPLAVEMAVWFHDAVYDPRAPDNEEKSAALALQRLTEAGASPELAATVSRLVLATKRHEAGNDPDAALLLDVDLGILGQTEARFQEYEAQIRREFDWVPVKTFAAKRAEILRQFLARDRIYATNYFHEKLEPAARANLQRSIQNLAAMAA